MKPVDFWTNKYEIYLEIAHTMWTILGRWTIVKTCLFIVAEITQLFYIKMLSKLISFGCLETIPDIKCIWHYEATFYPDYLRNLTLGCFMKKRSLFNFA